MDDIQYKKKSDRKSITLWFTDDQQKAVDLYESLGKEYAVDTPSEARTAILERMIAIAERLTKKQAG